VPLIVAILRDLAALKHHFADKDDVLWRMLPHGKKFGESLTKPACAARYRSTDLTASGSQRAA
jgi:hypothetical protein